MAKERMIDVTGQTVRVTEAGTGPALLFLHGAGAEWTPLHKRLSKNWHVVAPEHPGFGSSGHLPEWMDSVGDLAFFYRAFIRQLGLDDVTLVGHSIGGWLAAEIAIRSTERLRRLILLAPAGVASDKEPFPDIFLWSPEDFARRQFHDRSLGDARVAALSKTDIAVKLGNRAALARLAWNPRLHNPKLRRWLSLIDLPTLLIWGREDRIIPFVCNEGYLELLKDAELCALPESGHALPIERAEEVERRIEEFSRRTAA